jgi:hypothetical protein
MYVCMYVCMCVCISMHESLQSCLLPLVIQINTHTHTQVHEVYRTSTSEYGSLQSRLLPVVIRATIPEAGLYIRLHRREGCERVLEEEEFAAWGTRIDEILKPGGMFAGGEGTLPGQVWFMWGTVSAMWCVYVHTYIHA